MANLLKRVWGSVLNRPTRNSSPETSPKSSSAALSLGAFDKLPIDILMQILRLIGAKDAARMSKVCKYWKVLVLDNNLWIYFIKSEKGSLDSVVFAETYLRLGSRSLSYCRLYMDYCPQPSFMSIYAQRQKVPGALIIDGGSGYCKYGWSKYDYPSGHCATFLEFGNIESPMYARLRHFFSTIYIRMHVKPSSQPIIVSIPMCHPDDTESARASRKQLKEAIHTVLFDMNVPAVCAIDQAILALYSARCTSGIVINIGFHVTSIVPILQGRVMREVGVEVVGIGALKLTGYLKELMQQRDITFESLYTVRTIKEKLCYVAADYNAELKKETRASCEVPREGLFTLSKERFQAAEILFQPQIGGVHAMGLHRALALCMDHCAEAELSDGRWFKTIVLAGGTSCLPGLSERFEIEMKKLLPPSVTEGIKVIPPMYGADSAWFGAKMVSNVSTFSDAWCITRKQFRQKTRRNTQSFLGTW